MSLTNAMLTNVSGTSGYLQAWVNGTLVYAANISGLPATEAMTVSAAFQSGDASGPYTMDLDCIGAWNTRVAA